MTKVLITGARGFIGRNLSVALSRRSDLEVLGVDLDNATMLDELVPQARAIVHLAGINRPADPREFHTGNVELTQHLLALAAKSARPPAVILSSSTHAIGDTPYGLSKRLAEQAVFAYGRETGAAVHVFRLTNVFGKWCRPSYNSVVATFCHNIARGLPISIVGPDNRLELVYIDHVVAAITAALDGASPPSQLPLEVEPRFAITVSELARRVEAMTKIRETLVLPDLADPLTRYLHATFISYLDSGNLSYPLELRTDHRGSLAEILKTPHFGQIFVSRSKPGVIRGNHYHDSKIEKFCVVEGHAAIKFRAIDGSAVIAYEVRGEQPSVVDIPPGYTHSIENLGTGELIVLFWASEVFDPARPDTFALPVELKV